MADQTQKPLWFDSAVRESDILAVFKNTQEWLSRREIALRLHHVKSRAVFSVAEKLVAQACLEKTFRRLPNGVDMVYYRRREECEEGFETWSPD